MNAIDPCNCKAGSFTAILDRMPPAKPHLMVRGTVTCPTGGFAVSLVKAEPQGTVEEQLILNVVVTPPSGEANQMVTDHNVKYEEENSPTYTNVAIHPCDITIPVQTAW